MIAALHFKDTMFDPSTMTLGQVSSFFRDFSIVGTLMVVVWKSRGFYGTVSNFFERITRHMDVMEHGMKTLLTNHLSHIEADLKMLSGRKSEYSEIELLNNQNAFHTDDVQKSL